VHQHVVQEERPLLQRGQDALRLAAVERRALPGERAFEPVEQPRLVALGLQPAEEPGAGVRETLVVDVDRVLRRQHHAEAERTRLLHQQQQRLLRRRVGDRRHVAGDLVEIQHRAQARRARLRAHPADDAVEE
jgi:hypothetical protein